MTLPLLFPSANAEPALEAGRRTVLRAAAAGVAGFALAAQVRPAAATPEALAGALRAFAGDAPLRAGRVKLDVAPLVENGNTVPVGVSVETAQTAADHVREIALFNERNPQAEVALFTLGPRCGRANVSTRIRLATSQKLVAVAKMADGSCWTHSVDVVVTLAACIET